MNSIELIIPPRERDLGGFKVRRILPFAEHRMVGPFIFFDHMGPAHFPAGDGLNVRPHPHINLATVTYLFSGAIHHRDSLGSSQLIEPGAINWMIAGRGIVHSERLPDFLKDKPHFINGIQLWVAVPESAEEINPSFSHHPKSTLPEFQTEGASVKLLLGSALDHKSPVPVLSDLFYGEIRLSQGLSLTLPPESREAAIYLAEGKIEIEQDVPELYSMIVRKQNTPLKIKALENSIIMFLGGEPLGQRYIDWNFVSSSKERLEAAKKEWSTYGPRPESERFKPIPDDKNEFIPLKP